MESKLILDDQKILSLLADETFYAKVPEFLFMKDMALASISQYREKQSTTGCKECDAKKLLYPPLHVFRQHAVNLDRTCGQGSLSNLITFLIGRLGYRPRPIVLMYREENRGKQLVL